MGAHARADRLTRCRSCVVVVGVGQLSYLPLTRRGPWPAPQVARCNDRRPCAAAICTPRPGGWASLKRPTRDATGQRNGRTLPDERGRVDQPLGLNRLGLCIEAVVNCASAFARTAMDAMPSACGDAEVHNLSQIALRIRKLPARRSTAKSAKRQESAEHSTSSTGRASVAAPTSAITACDEAAPACRASGAAAR